MSPQFNSRLVYHRLGVKLIDSIIPAPTNPNADSNDDSQLLGGIGSIDDFIGAMSPNLDEFDFSAISDLDCSPSGGFTEPTPDFTAGSLSVTPNTNGSGRGPSTAATSPPSLGPTPSTNNNKVESVSCCEICGYRPEGDPRWFPGSMAKHKKLQHATSPPKIYHCRYPGCTSKYTNRPDNLRQHQIKKGHFVDGEEDTQDRPSKRKKMG